LPACCACRLNSLLFLCALSVCTCGIVFGTKSFLCVCTHVPRGTSRWPSRVCAVATLRKNFVIFVTHTHTFNTAFPSNPYHNTIVVVPYLT
jgi:hypothetical protein